MNYRLTRADVRKLAFEVATKNKIILGNWIKTKLAVVDQLYDFVNAYCPCLRKQEVCSLSKVTAVGNHKE